MRTINTELTAHVAMVRDFRNDSRFIRRAANGFGPMSATPELEPCRRQNHWRQCRPGRGL
jgi:hypothetical protein